LVKAIQGSKDAFLRLRVGNYRLMYEVDDPNKMVPILGIIHRKDLEEWLRQRH
jgi:mRNA-degrading endonuclease RelE of RelBE toxin-antitoxin system